jgi:hypothetical protein
VNCTPRAGSQAAIDGANGIDNAFSELIRQLGGDISEVGSAQYTHMLEESAASNLIFHVTGYNGSPNDPKVGVDVLWAAPSAVVRALAWNGSDVVRVDAASPGATSSVTPNAYVSGGHLVVAFDVLPLRLVFAVFPIGHAAFDLSLTNATVQCLPVMNRAGSWELQQCVLGGVVQVNDLLHQLSRFPDPAAAKAVSQPLCTDSPSYAAMRANVCGAADLPPNLGIGGFGVPSCGAVSVGMAFDMGAVQLGDTVTITTPQVIGCPATTDPANDNCITVFMGFGAPDGGRLR